jgi:hypothetical protein
MTSLAATRAADAQPMSGTLSNKAAVLAKLQNVLIGLSAAGVATVISTAPAAILHGNVYRRATVTIALREIPAAGSIAACNATVTSGD